MKELKIYEYQAKHVRDALQLVARVYECKSKETCLDRDVMQAIEMMNNILNEKPDVVARRF